MTEEKDETGNVFWLLCEPAIVLTAQHSTYKLHTTARTMEVWVCIAVILYPTLITFIHVVKEWAKSDVAWTLTIDTKKQILKEQPM